MSNCWKSHAAAQIKFSLQRWFDLPFVVKFRGFVYEEPTMTLFRGYVRRRLDADSFDHALLITG